MAEPFLAEIRIVSFNFAPKGWAMCNGGILAINQNQALFSLLGTTYGGNGQTTFALPDQRGRVPLHVGPGFNQGMVGGEQAHTLTINELPQHTHVAQATTVAATAGTPSTTTALATSTNYEAYRPFSNPVSLQSGSISAVGNSQAHTNLQPYLAVTFCIALQGLFPSQN